MEKQCFRELAQSRIRGLLNDPNKLDINIKLYDEILGKYLGKMIRDEIDIDTAITCINEELKK